MNKLVIVSLASLMIGSAFAMPAENANGDHSYSYQGQAFPVRVVTHERNIPAPSSWTPPERVQSARVTMFHRVQPRKVGGAGFSNPSFSNPTLSRPSFSNPTFSSPTFSNPSFSKPSYSNPSYNSPSFSKPSYSNPSYSNPGYSTK